MIFDKKILDALIELNNKDEKVLTKVFNNSKGTTSSEAFIVGKCIGQLLSLQSETTCFNNITEEETFIEMSKIQGILAEYEFQAKENKEITDANKVLKILFKMNIPVDMLSDDAWEWKVEELSAHKYLVSGFHPIASRATFRNDEFIVV